MGARASKDTPEGLAKLAQEKGVEFARLQFVDILGIVKSVVIPVERLERALEDGVRFDGSSIQGFVRVEESDMLLMPDPNTFTCFDWQEILAPPGRGGDRARGIPTARLICDVYRPDYAPFEGCPRLILKRVVAEAAEMDFIMRVGPEIEFYLFERGADGEGTTETRDQGAYLDLSPVDKGEEARRHMAVALKRLGLEIEASHHENSPGQHEIGLRHADPVVIADRIATARIIIRRIAAQYGLHATFMPKPVFGINGSGLHMHQSLYRGRRNAFFKEDAPMGLSGVAHHYVGGLMEHARALSLVTNPLINSYKRLVPGYEAPVHITWSARNRSPLIRVPAAAGDDSRVELRSPDPACNPYLALAAMLKAGLDGVIAKTVPPPPVNRNVYALSEAETRSLGIQPLPRTLQEAMGEMRRSALMREALGETIFHQYLQAKQIEWELYRDQVDQWELEQYLDKY